MEVNDAHHSPTQRGGGGGLEGMCVCLCESVSVRPSISVPL